MLIGEAPGLQLGVDQLSVERQFEAAAARGDQLQLADLLLVRREELARQTDGLRLVVSHRTVDEFHVHGILLLMSLLPTRKVVVS